MSWMFGTFSSLFDAYLSPIIDSFDGMAVSWVSALLTTPLHSGAR